MKRIASLLSIIVILAWLSAGSASAAVVNHNISSGSLVIPGTSTDDYVVTGNSTGYYIRAEFGYKGTITLKNCSFRFTSSGSNSPIRIVGKNNLSNTDPSRTNVNLILDGTNTIVMPEIIPDLDNGSATLNSVFTMQRKYFAILRKRSLHLMQSCI